MRSVSPYELYGNLAPATDAYLAEHIVVAGETLTGLAHRYYQDFREWRLIADRNRIADARAIEPGTLLLIPGRPPERGSFAST
jgi:nucleoid-associated protein YgaU